MTDDVLERLERYVANHPGASAMEVLANVGADPSQYRDAIESLLAGEDLDPDDVDTSERRYSESSTTNEVGDEAVRQHYQRVEPVLEELATVDGVPTGAFCGNAGWYTRRPATDIEDLEAGIGGWGRVKTLAHDRHTIASNVRDDADARSLYALTNYSDAFLKEAPFARTDDGLEWRGEPSLSSHDEKPTPEYSEISAFAPFADIDLASEHKERPLSDETQVIVEDALAEYVDAFADLMGGYDAVFALDSVGGAYVMGAPAATAQIAEAFDEEERERIFEALANRLNDWLESVDTDVQEAVPDAKGLFEADYINNKNRQYKTPLSIHKHINGVVHPLETEPSDSIDYPFIAMDDVDDDLVDETVSWTREFTDPNHADRVEDLVATLWPDEFEDHDDWQAALEAWLEEQREQERIQAARRAELETGEPISSETDVDSENVGSTGNLNELYQAVDNLDPFDVAEKTIVHRWTEDVSDAEDRSGSGKKAFIPTWGTDYSSGNANYIDEKGVWIDSANGDHGTVVEMALISAGGWTRGKIAKGAEWFRGLDELRELGFDIPEYEPSDEDTYKGSGDGRAVSALPIAQLDALDPAERRRFAKKRGLEWPSTDDAREELFDTIAEVMRNEDDRIVDAPTSLGKSFTIASTRWGARQELTGERPVIHLLETRDARDEAVDVAEEHGGQYHVLLGRHEACPVCAGDHDEITIDGEPASDWLDAQCEGKGMPFSAAHRYLEENNDQGVTLPCSEDSQCSAIEQWETYREGPDGELEYWPLVIATHNFAFAPGLRTHNNVVVDEEPSYEQDDLTTERIRSAVGAYLREIDAPVQTWEAFIQLSLHDDYQGDAAKERDAPEDVLWTDPGQDWYFEDPDAHTLAPALARAIFRAEDRANGRRFGKTGHEPPRLEAGAREDDDWNREWVSVVLDESNDVRSVRTVPDFGAARSLVGLDAHPAVPLWQANTVPWIKTTDVLEPEPRQLWRRYERGLRVVQVGDATRPLSGDKALEWLNEDKLEALFEHLVDEYGTQFRTAITTAQVEDRVEELMEDAGVHRPELMHFGEEKSRNDFANERVGLVNGCMDPGDDYVLDLLAELDLEAEVEIAVDDAGEEYRARGRGFDGADAASAQEILASVRENHIAQAAGRYARSPDDPDVTATVFVRTDAMPVGFADIQTPGVEWMFTDLQEAIVDELRSNTGAKTAREISEAVGCSKEHVRQTLERLADDDHDESAIQVVPRQGPNGATLYSDSGIPHTGVVDIHESPTDPYSSSTRWTLAVRDPTTGDDAGLGSQAGSSDQPTEEWDWKAGPDPGD